ncbi:hypothetical protein CDL12_21672 [Handroanthus impetiginosus]|uniref:Uncharacterized protein n=1 Tax=Handroanthus impetiginosus TaxID=429701 RepID=A0A2G9GKP9_9LAMI|nr:hypothetical protein CDL12_21672 [Handroanthus impetiginosus]
MEEMRWALKGVLEMIMEGMAFDDNILAEFIPSNYRLPRIPEYHGTTILPSTYADDESLRDYLRRFTMAVLEVPSAHKEVLANSFVNGLTEGPFFAALGDPLVITATVANYDVAKVFVDCGSSIDILFMRVFWQMDLGRVKMEPVQTALIILPLTLGKSADAKTKMVRFLIMDTLSTYNAILSRPVLNFFQAVPSTYHQKIKYPVDGRVGEIRGDQFISKRCYVEAVGVFDNNKGPGPADKAN